jgi:hypothetical protein
MAFAGPLIAGAIEAAPEILSAASMAGSLIQKYGPSLAGSVNNLFHMGHAKKSSLSYIKNLASPKGLQKFITKDIGSGVRHVAKVAGGVGGLANTVQRLTAGSTGVSGGVNKIAGLVGSAARMTTRYHTLAEKYHTQAKSLVSPLKAYRF